VTRTVDMSSPVALLTLVVLLGACAAGSGTTTAGGATSAGGGGGATSSSPSSGGGDAGSGGDEAGAGGDDGDQGGVASGGGGGPIGDFEAGGDRPVTVRVPSGYDGEPAPLLLVLHGYASTGALAGAYFALQPAADAHGVLLAAPDGLADATSARYWNGTAACCDYYGNDPDDVGYLVGLIDEIASRVEVDPRRVYVLGHSNGGFMAYRTACDAAAQVAAIVSLSGATEYEAADCAPSEPVSVLEIHGTGDTVVAYAGGFIGAEPFPSAVVTAETWAAYDGCDADPTSDADLRDVVLPPGGDTIVERWGGCEGGSGVELWTVQGGLHQPYLAVDFGEQVLEFLLAHPKP
jgi:polyhydroxybutyrate depolymerase